LAASGRVACTGVALATTGEVRPAQSIVDADAISVYPVGMMLKVRGIEILGQLVVDSERAPIDDGHTD